MNGIMYFPEKHGGCGPWGEGVWALGEGVWALGEERLAPGRKCGDVIF